MADTTKTTPEPAPKRRGPGRPPKNKPKKRLDRRGIIEKPSNFGKVPDRSVNTIELVYENPQMFKKIFQLFKVYNVEQISVLFDVDKLYMYALDHTKNVTLCVEILGSMMNAYYVEKPWHINLDTGQFHKIFQGIGKEFTRIVFVTSRSHQNIKIWMIFFDDQNNNSRYEIELNDPKEDEVPLENVKNLFAQHSTYPVSFELDFKRFKSKIAELGNLSKKFEIQQDLTRKGTSIYFTSKTVDNKVKNTSPLNHPGKINLVNTYTGDLFTAPIFISNIKPFSASTISDTASFYVDDKKDIIFKTALDLDDNPSNKEKLADSEKGYIWMASKLAFSEDYA